MQPTNAITSIFMRNPLNILKDTTTKILLSSVDIQVIFLFIS